MAERRIDRLVYGIELVGLIGRCGIDRVVLIGRCVIERVGLI
jgi:hypothetical protein